MTQTITPPPDDFKIRCPRLGQQIQFSYCRQENQGFPCFKALDCWYPYFQVVDFFRQELSADDWQAAFEKPARPKILTLVEVLDQVQKRVAADAKDETEN